MMRWGRGTNFKFYGGHNSYAGGIIKFLGISQSSPLGKTMTSAVSPNQHVHFAHDEVTLIIVFSSNNQFIELKDGLARSIPPLATTTHRL